jgi:hypothetical protein
MTFLQVKRYSQCKNPIQQFSQPSLRILPLSYLEIALRFEVLTAINDGK